MCITCETIYSAGDMAPRMILCDDTKLPVVPFISEKIIIREWAEKWDIGKQEVLNMAWELLKNKQKEYKDINDIYFCEDHFSTDLQKHFKEVNALSESTKSGKYPSPPEKPDARKIYHGIFKDCLWNRMLDFFKIKTQKQQE